MEIYNDDCFNVFPKIKNKVDMVLVDLPYSQTACKWDIPIDLKHMWIELKKICKKDCIYVFFCTTKFGYKLIQSNEKNFRYDIVWEKSRKVGFLSANKMPLRKHEMMYVFKEKQGTYNPQKTEGKRYVDKRNYADKAGYYRKDGKLYTHKPQDNKGLNHPTSILQIPEVPEEQEERKHEMVYVFSDTNSDDLDNSRNLGLRAYFKNVMEYIGKTKKELMKKIGQSIDHSLRFNSSQFALPTEKTYNKLIEVYELDKMEGFRKLEDLKNEWGEPTYNPQKTEGKPYKTNGADMTNTYYRGGNKEYKSGPINNKGDRHPTSILHIPEVPENQEERQHEMVYVFKEKQGTYNPQKIKGKPYNKTNTGNNNKDSIIYGKVDRSNYLEGDEHRSINKGDRHPSSILHIPDVPENQEERQHEMVYIFSDTNSDDLDNSRNLELRTYAKQVKEYINKTIKEIDKTVGNLGIHHFYSFNSTQFRLPTQKTYDKLIEIYNINKMEGFRTLEDLKNEWKKIREPTYNPQKTKGKPYKVKGHKLSDNVYGADEIPTHENKTGDRHPTSILKIPEAPEEQKEREHDMVYIFKEKQGTYNPQKTTGHKPRVRSNNKKTKLNLVYGDIDISTGKDTDETRHPTTIVKFNNPVKSVHRTQKPVDLCEWLIKSYSNEGDTIMDFTMGSGSTGVACINTDRKFIGIEKDEKIFKIAKKRIDEKKNDI
jgi:16S rRNA G966 N2-methylase RsmD